MSTTYYECHVTMLEGKGDKEALKLIVEGQSGWRFSAIEGDINLGSGVKFYATRQFNSKLRAAEVIDKLTDMGKLMRSVGAEVLREKVEIVIFDTRSSKVRAACDDCASCQEARG